MLAPACSFALLISGLGPGASPNMAGASVYRAVEPEVELEGGQELSLYDPSGKDKSKFVVKGGVTMPPPRTLGLPPWRKSMNAPRRYTWHVKVVAGEAPNTEPAAEVPSPSSILLLGHDKPTSVEVTVTLHELWTDAAGYSIFWPELPKSGKTKP